MLWLRGERSGPEPTDGCISLTAVNVNLPRGLSHDAPSPLACRVETLKSAISIFLGRSHSPLSVKR
jgi:hypothetical protein